MALLRDQRHGEFVGFSRGVDREADVAGESGSDGVGEGLEGGVRTSLGEFDFKRV